MSSHQITEFESDFWYNTKFVHICPVYEFGIVISEVEGGRQAGAGTQLGGHLT